MAQEVVTIKPEYFDAKLALNLFYPFFFQGQIRSVAATASDKLSLSSRTALTVEAMQGQLEDYKRLVPLSEDPLFKASKNLSLPFLASFALLGQISSWPNYIFNKRYPEHSTQKIKEDAELVETILKKPAKDRDLFEQSMLRYVQDSRRLFSYFVMEELITQSGFDLQRDFVVPMKLFETEIGYELNDPSLENRVRGLTIPLPIRELRGWIDFAAKARASHSIVSALIPAYQWLAVTNAYHMDLIRSAFEEALGIELTWDGKEFQLTKGSLDSVDIPATALQHPLLQAVHAIVATDYGLNMFTEPQRMTDLAGISDWAFSTSTHLIDPAIAKPLLHFPDIEQVNFNALKLPKGNLYRFNQVYSANAAARQFYQPRKKDDRKNR